MCGNLNLHRTLKLFGLTARCQLHVHLFPPLTLILNRIAWQESLPAMWKLSMLGLQSLLSRLSGEGCSYHIDGLHECFIDAISAFTSMASVRKQRFELYAVISLHIWSQTTILHSKKKSYENNTCHLYLVTEEKSSLCGDLKTSWSVRLHFLSHSNAM